MKKKPLIIALGLTSTMGLVGCGSGNSSTTKTDPGATPYIVTAIDGYLSKAQVWLDLDGDFQPGAGEPSAITGAGGKASLDVTGIDNPEKYAVVVRSIKGQTIDESTGNTVAADYVMSAPAGQTDITPLSTLVHVKVKSAIKAIEADTMLSAAEKETAIAAAPAIAVTEVANEIGIDENTVLGNFIAGGNDEAAFSARSLVSSGAMPENTNEINIAAQGTDTTLLDKAATVNAKIKTEIDDAATNPEKDLDKVVFNQTGNADTDNDSDGVANEDDAFPENKEEWLDSDNDGTGDNADLDDDDDGTPDLEDEMPFDDTEQKDADQDGVGDNADLDDDNDGVEDGEDAFPFDGAETLDTDNDGTGNNADTDDDGDDVADTDDAFPLDSSESVDTDGDTIGNNADTDDDGDDVLDENDAFPLDKTETLDTDGDKIGNNADTDDDGDNVSDDNDAFPLDKNETVDTDNDGTGNNTDTDDDNDGVADGDDAFPLDSSETLDSDRDGTGDNADNDDDNDSVPDEDDLDPLDPKVGLSQNTATMAFIKENSAVYTIDGRGNNNKDLILETITVTGDAASLTATNKVNPDGTLAPTNGDTDRVLTKDGWTAGDIGYTIDFSGKELIAYPTGYSELQYGISSSVIDLTGRNISQFNLGWNEFTNTTATYAAASTAAQLNMTPAQDIYYIWNSQTWVHGQEANATSLSELKTTTSAGDNIAANSLYAVSLGQDIAVELVEDDVSGGTANYYTIDWNANTAMQVGSATWTQQSINGEELIVFTIAAAAITNWGDKYHNDSPHMIFSVYDNTVHRGSLEKANEALQEDSVYLLNASAKSDFLAAADVSLKPCYSGDKQSNAIAADFTNALADCGGFSAITEAMVAGKNFQRVKSNGDTRDYSFASDGTVTVYRSEAENYTQNWSITSDGMIQMYYETGSTLWANTDRFSTQWAIKVYEDHETFTSEVYAAIVTQQAYTAPVVLTACETDDSGWDDDKNQPIVFKTLQQFTAAVNSCSADTGNSATFTQAMLAQGLELKAERIVDGETVYLQHYQFHAPTTGANSGTGTISTEDDFELALTWSITSDGMLKIDFSYTDDNGIARTGLELLAIVAANDDDVSVKLFSRSSEWQGTSDSAQGEIWSEIFSTITP